MDVLLIFRRFSSLALIVFVGLIHVATVTSQTPQNTAYFNGSASVTTNTNFDPNGQLTFQFRTCTGGELLSQSYNGQLIAVSVDQSNGSLRIQWNDGTGSKQTNVGQGYNDNLWTLVDFSLIAGVFVVSVRDEVTEVTSLINLQNLDLSGAEGFSVGTGYTGCLEEVAGLNLAAPVSWSNVVWGQCPLEADVGCSQDPCASQPCMNNGVCSPSGGGFQCSCTARYSNDTCNVDNGPLCNNQGYALQCVNGTCVEDGISNSTLCDCSPGFGGELCNMQFALCDANPCANGGTCRSNAALDNTICSCVAGYFGDDCSLVIDNCAVNPCLNNGVCMNGINSYTCDCLQTGYRGQRCEIPQDDCALNPCQNSGVCTDTRGGYYCSCTAGNVGANCDQNLCSYLTPCENGGTCNPAQGDFNCTCAAGFTGVLCETDIDECASTPCENNGACEDAVNGFECLCRQGFIGYDCSVELNECNQGDLNLCQNNSTCVDLVNDIECACVAGFTGAYCEHNIDECESSPCTNNATCVDLLNEYRCVCSAGFTGADCGVNIDECMSEPCLNEGQCNDLINGFVCDCSGTGFDGETCSNNIDDCMSTPCQNDGTCLDGVLFYNCSCWAGYEGTNCEIDINECASTPCQNGATCLERSNQMLYQPGNPYEVYVPDEFSYANASGYVCVCLPGYEGDNCEINIDECASSPCQNGATCVDLVNGYRCDCPGGYDGVHCANEIDECASFPCLNGATCTDLINEFMCECAEGWGDVTCNVELIACDNNDICQNGATCLPYFDVDTGAHGFDCLCVPGYTGDNCTVDTSISFEGLPGESGYVSYPVTSPSQPFHFTLTFATTLQEGYLLFAEGYGVDIVTIELQEAKLAYTFSNGADVLNSVINMDVANGDWYTLEISLTVLNSAADSATTTAVNMTLTSDSCPNRMCQSVQDTLNFTFSSFQDVYFGGVPASVTPINNPFTGCMRDVSQIDDSPVQGGDSSSKPMAGCRRTPQCNPDPCNGRGLCTDLWWTFTCECQLGYTGPGCETSFIQGTFSFENTTSYASFDLTSYSMSPTENIVQFIFRTRESNGLLFYTAVGQEYLVIKVNNSTVFAEVSLGGITSSLQIPKMVADGNYHSVMFVRQPDSLSLSLDSGTPISRNLSSSSSTDFGKILVGGVADFSEGTLPSVVSESTYFKGCIWDVKYNSYSLEFFPLTITDFVIDSIPMDSNSSNVLSMCNSDDACTPEPCHNNGVCSITWNDFECDCPSGFGGKNCSEETICAIQPCPAGAACLDRDGGYECVAPATFDGDSPLIKYSNSLNATRNINTISLRLRTRRTNGLVLHASNSVGHFVTLQIQQSQVALRFSFGTLYEIVPSLDVSDGVWHFVQVIFGSVESRRRKKRAIATTTVTVDNVTASRETDLQGSLGDIISGGSGGVVYLAGTDFTNNQYFTDYTPYQGNMDDVRVGTFLLPFFNSTVYNATNEEQFYALDIAGVTIGSEGADVCGSSPCRNGGNCSDDWNAYSCSCPSGFTGTNCDCSPGITCSVDVEDCASSPCYSGTCTDLVSGGYSCNCPSYYEGPKCSVDVNECISLNPCQNGGNCTNIEGNYTCQCPEGFVGHDCETTPCSPNPCEHNGLCSVDLTSPSPDSSSFRCNCSLGYGGKTCALPECSAELCLNGGQCRVDATTGRWDCSCVEFFEGSRCEFRGPCAINSCINGGTCDQSFNAADGTFTFQCNCPTGFNGTYCDNEIVWCDSNPCQQEGSICTSDREFFYCQCAPGYGGDFCEIKLPDCASNLCQNGANCTDLTYDYQCTCAAGWDGKNCDVDINECESNPCQNGATCNDRVNDYFCDCTDTGYQGKNCAVDVAECSGTNPCLNGGTCVEVPGSFRCECPPGYTGDTCRTMSTTSNLGLIIGVSLAGGILLIVLIVLLSWFVCSVRKKRATEGSYSPSRQEMTGSFVEMDNVLKMPPEERLI